MTAPRLRNDRNSGSRTKLRLQSSAARSVQRHRYEPSALRLAVTDDNKRELVGLNDLNQRRGETGLVFLSDLARGGQRHTSDLSQARMQKVVRQDEVGRKRIRVALWVEGAIMGILDVRGRAEQDAAAMMMPVPQLMAD